MAADFGQCLDQLDQLEGILKELTELAQGQTRAVLRGELAAVDESIRRQQALSLTLRGLDQKRLKLLRELGLERTTLSQLPGKVPDEYALRARQTVDRVESQYTLYLGAQQLARTTLECNLHMIEKHMPQERASAVSGGVRADIRA